MPLRFTRKLIRLTALGFGSYFGYQAYVDYTSPKPMDWAALNEKEKKRIVVVGTGMVGLTTAYFTSRHKENEVIVLERQPEPYRGTSYKNGNWMTINHTYSWINVPFYPFIWKAITDWKENVAKVYTETFVQDQCSILVTLKFGFRWLLFQPTAQQYGATTMRFHEISRAALLNLVKEEGIDLSKDLIFQDGAQCLMLQENNSDFSKIMHGVDTFAEYPQFSKVDQFNRRQDPTRFKEEVDLKFGKLVPAVYRFTDALYRTLNILDTTQLGKTLLGALAKRENVKVLLSTEANGYEIEKETGMVKAVKTSNPEHPSLPCDVVVLCNSPSAPYHIYEHFGCVLPSIQAQGYAYDLHYENKELHTGMSLRMNGTPYSYCQFKPGVIRQAAFVDFGCFKKPYEDPERVKFLKDSIRKDLGIENPELHDLWVGLRPISPDNLEIIGPMRSHPNVILNVGYGPQGFQSLCGSQIVDTFIQNDEQRRKDMIGDNYSRVSPKRLHI